MVVGKLHKKLYAVIGVFTLVLLTVFTMPSMGETTKDVELVISAADLKVNTTETRSVELTIINNQAVEDTFSLSVWPSTTWSGITPNLEKDKIIKLPAGANSTTRLFFSVESGADEIITTFLVSVGSISNPNATDSGSVNVRVIRKTAIYISDLKLDKYILDQSDCITIISTITNFASTSGPYRLQTDIKSGSTLITRFDDFIESVEGKSIKELENRYCFDKYATTGTYTIETTLKTSLNKFVDSRLTTFKINKVPNLVYEKKVAYNPFAQIKTIRVKNEGNVVEEDFYVTETVSEFVSKFFYPEEESVMSEPIDGKVSYKWLIDSLAPGEETVIRYEVRFFSIWFSGLMIVVVVFMAFSYVYKPKIRKSATPGGPIKRGKDISVMLEIKNSTIHEIKNLTVKDTVPPIAKVDERFDTMKPDVKKSDAGTEMTWKIKSLQPLEERVLTYRIKPVVEVVGSLRMPSATITYVDNKKRKKIMASRALEIKS